MITPHGGAIFYLGITIATLGCRGGQTRPAANYELHCESSDTDSQSQLFCIRLDTRTGEAARVNHIALPVSSGSGVDAAALAGTYTLACDATTTRTRSDLYCVRLHRFTGEMVLVSLPQLPEIPR